VRRTDGALTPHLVVPYTLDANDMRFALPQGFRHGDEFFDYCADAFDVMYDEGAARPSMMSVGMHCRPPRTARPQCVRCSASSTSRGHDRVWVHAQDRHRAPLESECTLRRARRIRVETR
jgi:hypothetical protein